MKNKNKSKESKGTKYSREIRAELNKTSLIKELLPQTSEFLEWYVKELGRGMIPTGSDDKYWIKIKQLEEFFGEFNKLNNAPEIEVPILFNYEK